MTPDQKQYLSLQLIRIGQLMEIAQILADLLAKESFVAGDHKASMRAIINNLEQAKRRMLAMLTDKSRETSHREVLDEATVLQTCTLIDLLSAMDEEHRARLVAYADAIYLDYSAVSVGAAPAA